MDEFSCYDVNTLYAEVCRVDHIEQFGIEFQQNVRKAVSQRLHSSRWMLAFAVAWPFVTLWLWWVGAFNPGHVIVNVLIVLAMLASVLQVYRKYQRPLWTAWTGHLVLVRIEDLDEAKSHLCEMFDRTRMEQYAGTAFVFRRKSDAAWAKLTWG